MNKKDIIKYLKNKIYKLNYQLQHDDYADRNYILWATQTLENTIELVKGK